MKRLPAAGGHGQSVMQKYPLKTDLTIYLPSFLKSATFIS